VLPVSAHPLKNPDNSEDPSDVAQLRELVACISELSPFFRVKVAQDTFPFGGFLAPTLNSSLSRSVPRAHRCNAAPANIQVLRNLCALGLIALLPGAATVTTTQMVTVSANSSFSGQPSITMGSAEAITP
jgi:hypothetical protein